MLLSVLVRLNMLPHMSEGLGSMFPSITRLGRADNGVSNSLFPDCVFGGAGLANGFGGPAAPAERRGLLADGEGGGRTTPFAGCVATDALASCAEELSVSSSASEASVGILTVRRGRRASEPNVLERAV